MRLRTLIMRAGWRVYLAVGLLASVAYFLLPAGSATQTNLYRVVAFSTAAAVLAGSRMYRPPARATWPLLAAGMLFFALGDTAWSVWPTLADPLYLAAYPALIAAVGWLAFQHGRPRIADLLDTAILCVGAGLLLWILLIDFDLHEASASQSERIVAAAYPIMDLVLFAALVYFITSGVKLSRVYQAIGLGFGVLLASDVVWGRMDLAGTYVDGAWIDAGWLASYVVIGAAVLHPAVAKPLARRTPELRPGAPWLRICLLATASLIAPAVLVGQVLMRSQVEVDATVACGVAMTVLTFVRLGLLLGEHVVALEAQRASESKLRLALEWTNTSYWEWEPASGEFTGVARNGELLPRSEGGGLESWIRGQVLPEDQPHVAAAAQKALDDGRDFAVEYRMPADDGSIHWIETQAYVAPRPDGGSRLFGLTRDVGERKRLEEQYRQAQKMEAVGQLAGGVAHDFNNLLTAILGYCALAKESEPQDEAGRRDKLAKAIHAAERAESLTQQLLAFSRRQRLDPTVLDLEAVVRGTQDLLRPLIGEHVDVVVRSGHDAGRVRADADQLTQVIVNLAVNARDAMPGGGTLALEVDGVELPGGADGVPAGSYVRLTVSDTGHGMDEETLRRAFEPFFTTKPVGAGTGLGLATVFGIVTQSGGHVTVESAPGAGTAFSVYLPRTSERAADPAVVPGPPREPGSERVLVVEDEPIIRELLAETLADDGYDVTAAASATEALPLALEGRFDLVITDLVMPGMSGEQLAVALEALSPGPRVILMSGYVYDTLSPDAPALPFLGKPFSMGELRAIVRATLDAHPPTLAVAAG